MKFIQIMKINSMHFENIIENIHKLREKILYMLSLEKFFRDEQQTDTPTSNDDK